MKKNIIVHTGNISIGGQEKMLIEFLKVLSPIKYNVKLFIEENKGEKNFYEKDIPDHIEYSFFTKEEFMVELEKQKKSKSIIDKLMYSLNLKKKKKMGIDILNNTLKEGDILIDYDMGLLRNLDKINLKGVKVVGWSHAGEGERLKNKNKDQNMFLYKNIVAVNSVMEEGYKRNYKKENSKVYKVENFIDNKEILKKGELIINDSNYGSYILSVGSLTDNKDHKSLIIGFKKYLLENKSDLNLVIIGEGRKRNELEKAIEELELIDRVFLIGNRSNPYPYMKNCVCYVQSSRAESFSLVLAEAMNFGKVIISKSNIGSRYVLKNGEYGVLVEDIENELSIKLKEILEDKKLKRKYEKLSQKRALDFSKEVAKDKIEELIEKL